MANISCAAGTIELFVSKDLKEGEKERFWEILESTQKEKREEGKDFDRFYEYHFEINKKKDSNLVDFIGYGRWSFDSNLEKFSIWLKNDNNNAYRFLPKKERDFIENLDFELEFWFYDVDESCDMLYTQGIKISHKAKTPLEECVTTTSIETEFFDCIHDNIEKLACKFQAENVE